MGRDFLTQNPIQPDQCNGRVHTIIFDPQYFMGLVRAVISDPKPDPPEKPSPTRPMQRSGTGHNFLPAIFHGPGLSRDYFDLKPDLTRQTGRHGPILTLGTGRVRAVINGSRPDLDLTRSDI
jgi:hypothetical protein